MHMRLLPTAPPSYPPPNHSNSPTPPQPNPTLQPSPIPTHLDEIGLPEAAGGEGGGADADAARHHRALVARHAVLVQRDVHEVQNLCSRTRRDGHKTRTRLIRGPKQRLCKLALLVQHQPR